MDLTSSIGNGSIMEWMILGLVAVSSLASFAAIGGCISYWKHRRPLEGFFLGAVLGPIGLVLELMRPFGHRPMIDQGARTSFQSLVEYQAESRAELQSTSRDLSASTVSPAKRPVY